MARTQALGKMPVMGIWIKSPGRRSCIRDLWSEATDANQGASDPQQ